MRIFFAEATRYKLSKMKSYFYPNLTIVEETGIILIGPKILDNAMVTRIPEYARDELFAQNIRDAIENQLKVDIQQENIAHYGPNFLHPHQPRVSSSFPMDLFTYLASSVHSCHGP